MMMLFILFLSGYIFLYLWNILGEYTGFEKKGSKKTGETADIELPPEEFRSINFSDEKHNQNLERLEEKIKNFSLGSFLKDSKKAFKLIIEAYSKNEWDILEKMVTPDLLTTLQKNAAMELKNIDSIESELRDIEVFEHMAKIFVLFRSNQNDRWVVDFWAFENNYRDDKWLLSEILKP